jgi:hypothetical protein
MQRLVSITAHSSSLSEVSEKLAFMGPRKVIGSCHSEPDGASCSIETGGAAWVKSEIRRSESCLRGLPEQGLHMSDRAAAPLVRAGWGPQMIVSGRSALLQKLVMANGTTRK